MVVEKQGVWKECTKHHKLHFICTTPQDELVIRCHSPDEPHIIHISTVYETDSE
jgi:hypothetical protein